MLNKVQEQELKRFAKSEYSSVLKNVLEDMRETCKKMIVSHALNGEMEYLTNSTNELRIINRLINKIFGGN